jgi:hypothetical protein
MSLISIPGMTEDALLNLNTAPSGGGLRPFPCDANGWTSHTAHVVKAEVKSFDSGDDYIAIVVANVQYGGEILVSLDPSKVAPGLAPAQEQKMRENNLKSLMLAVKILGCHTGGKVDTKKLDKATGQLVTVIAKHKGFRQGKDGNWYHKISLILTGDAQEEVDVKGPELPALPGSAPTSSSAAFDPDAF